ncbi:glucose-1-phosphate adenylyltransferase [Bythopirellula goksoeyrii]|uniref:Glucose-1-phosphate adenylyltransferase n=1 Tax=Bythopirellula goksoeyrii TaxID=1400387 RepID=A0A5B9QA37_9BACT|nr:glucose-1-phosphate adenylyltransferase [Bythopirellula goksoeyrii]QEG34312.1 Glucose-1-phosphate adenylyltransferase [Bythopirellula goksoeyrii]
MRNTIAVVLGGGQGSRLMPLTKYRSKPAVPLAGKYRLIDIPLSNCLNSGLNRIYVLTQFLSVSLHRHIRGTYRFDNFSAGFVELLAAQQTMAEGTDWYQGTADAVRKNLRYLTQPGTKYVVILSGDQLYHMDFTEMLKTHRESGADITIAAKPVHSHEAGGLGIMRADDTGRVIRFAEKPKTEEELNSVRTSPAWIDAHGVSSMGRDCLASMGIYIFNADVLASALENTDHRDFGREVFPTSIGTRKVQLHLFDGYWEDIGTIRSFFEANLQLTLPNAPFELTDSEAVIYSRPRFLPPTRFDGATIESSLVADGCIIEPGTHIVNSVIGLRCKIGRNVTIRDSIIMGADFYESPGATRHTDEWPAMGIGDGTLIEKAIVDKNCRIGPGAQVVNPGDRPDCEVNEVCSLRDGILVVEKDACLPAEWHV